MYVSMVFRRYHSNLVLWPSYFRTSPVPSAGGDVVVVVVATLIQVHDRRPVTAVIRVTLRDVCKGDTRGGVHADGYASCPIAGRRRGRVSFGDEGERPVGRSWGRALRIAATGAFTAAVHTAGGINSSRRGGGGGGATVLFPPAVNASDGDGGWEGDGRAAATPFGYARTRERSPPLLHSCFSSATLLRRCSRMYKVFHEYLTNVLTFVLFINFHFFFSLMFN